VTRIKLISEFEGYPYWRIDYIVGDNVAQTK